MNLQVRISAVDAAAILAVTIQAGVALWLWGQLSALVPLHLGGHRVIWQDSARAAWSVGYSALLSALALGMVMSVERRAPASPAFAIVVALVKCSLTLVPMARALALFAAAISV